jgi:hypothetical protein
MTDAIIPTAEVVFLFSIQKWHMPKLSPLRQTIKFYSCPVEAIKIDLSTRSQSDCFIRSYIRSYHVSYFNQTTKREATATATAPDDISTLIFMASGSGDEPSSSSGYCQ